MSKGDWQRKPQVSMAQVDYNWDTIFGKKDTNMQVRVNEEIGQCGCGRSPTGKCIGWHGLSEEAYQAAHKVWLLEQKESN
jgi:hypothetical protein